MYALQHAEFHVHMKAIGVRNFASPSPPDNVSVLGLHLGSMNTILYWNTLKEFEKLLLNVRDSIGRAGRSLHLLGANHDQDVPFDEHALTQIENLDTLRCTQCM